MERIEEMSQAITRLTEENRASHLFFESRLKLLWENVNQRNERIGAAMRKFLEHAEETSRHLGLRDAASHLEDLLKVPVLAWNTESVPTKTIPPPTTSSIQLTTILPPFLPHSERVEYTSPTGTTTGLTVPEGYDGAPSSNKRSADAFPGESNKKRKIGEP
jgi:hypothetical protein